MTETRHGKFLATCLVFDDLSLELMTLLFLMFLFSPFFSFFLIKKRKRGEKEKKLREGLKYLRISFNLFHSLE